MIDSWLWLIITTNLSCVCRFSREMSTYYWRNSEWPSEKGFTDNILGLLLYDVETKRVSLLATLTSMCRGGMLWQWCVRSCQCYTNTSFQKWKQNREICLEITGKRDNWSALWVQSFIPNSFRHELWCLFINRYNSIPLSPLGCECSSLCVLWVAPFLSNNPSAWPSVNAASRVPSCFTRMKLKN